ncbi:MAG: FAD-dependent oxidoreductase, partial [Lachnospiraceae bacterium]|nr:FAD-dependent oxidoreductase [Lachnospiraceae bacterium]
QIHKFFGSKEPKAKIRGFRIGQELLKEAEEAGGEVVLNATVLGLYPEKEVLVQQGEEVKHYKGDAVLVATGAAENMVNFRGWTLPGVIGAGAAQTMMNLHHIKPGNRILMLGTGNVGLVVSFQLMQAGCEVVALADAAPKIGGYGVHAAKVARTGVPFYLSHTIKEVEGKDCVTGVTIAQVDSYFQFIPGTEKHFDVDTVCVAVGLSPMAQLLKMDGIEMDTSAGGFVPKCDEVGATSIPGIYAAGDVAGIEEASSAMIEGRMSGAAIAEYLGYTDAASKESREKELEKSLDSLRQGMFAPKNRGKKIEKTDEGIPVSESLLTKGYVADDEITRFPGFRKQVKVHPVIECTQNIPCNPCQDACKKGCISIGDNITSLPISVEGSECINCGMCVASCSGQAIFLVAEDTEPGFGEVTIPYEFLPLPEKGDKGYGLSRSGQKLCDVEITNVRTSKAFDGTNLVTMKVPMEYIDKARFYKAK